MDWTQIVSVLMLMAFFFGVLIYAQAIRRMEATIDRMEAAAVIVAENLTEAAKGLAEAAKQRVDQGNTLDRMEAATHVVADDLAASIGRADAADESVPGMSADAGHRSKKT